MRRQHDDDFIDELVAEVYQPNKMHKAQDVDVGDHVYVDRIDEADTAVVPVDHAAIVNTVTDTLAKIQAATIVSEEEQALADCPEDLRLAILERRVDDLMEFDFTDVVRVAHTNGYLRDVVSRQWGFQPLPIRRHLPTTIAFLPQHDGQGGREEWVVRQWLVKVGDKVVENQPLLQVRSAAGPASGVQTLHAEKPGCVAKLHVSAGTPLRPNMILATMDGEATVHLHKHQVEAIWWMHEIEKAGNSGGMSGGILKLDMGLGKTLTAISYSLLARGGGGAEWPTLILTSKMVMAEWHRNGFHKFFHVAGFAEKKPGEIRVLFLDKSFMTAAAMDGITRHQIIQYDFVVVTYDTVAGACKRGRYHEANLELDPNYPTRILSVHPRQRAQSDDATATGLGILFKTPWERVFADESTRFSNHSTKLYQYVMAIYGRFKYCLTGTPIVNKSLGKGVPTPTSPYGAPC